MVSALRGIAAAGAIALALTVAACSPPSSPPTEPQEVESLKLAMIGGMNTPDPHIYYGARGLNVISNVNEGLVRYEFGTTTPSIQPWLATEWEANDDYTEWTFTLREDVTFHDGTAFDSSAIEPSFERFRAMENGAAYLIADVADISTPDARTVVIHLSEPNASFAELLASPYSPKILSPAGLEKNAGTDNAKEYLTSHDLGSGPYELTSAQADVGFTLTAFDDWWGEKPTFTTVEIAILQDVASAQVMLDSGELAAIQEGLTTVAFDSYADREGFTAHSIPVTRVELMRINPHRAPFDDAEFRQAFRNAIDYESLVETLWSDTAEVADSIYGRGFLSDGLGAQDLRPADPDALAALVDALPLEERSITLGYRDWMDVDGQLVNLLAAQLQELGMTVDIYASPSGAGGESSYIDNLSTAPHVAFAQTYPDGLSPYLWANVYWTSDGPLNRFGCSDAFIDDNIEVALRANDEQLYAKIGDRANEIGCWTNVAYLADPIVTQDWLIGVEAAHDVTAPSFLYLPNLGVAD